MTRPTLFPAKTIAITGGARGIGYQTAKELIGRGHRVAIGDIDEARAKEAADELGISSVARLDVTDPDSFRAFLDMVETQLGPIDVLINNAGIMPTGHVHEEEDTVTRRQVEINVLGVIFGTKLALQRMLPRRAGHIINTASLAGELSVPGLATYCGTKFAVIGFTEAARQEYRKSGVCLSTVRPTFTNTELVAGTSGAKGLRNAEPQEIARATADLIEQPRPFVRVTRVAGGMVAAMKFVPGRLATALGSALGTDSVFLDDVDMGARQAYLERIRNS
ncbi:SDR family oxidoreductase [Nocardioides caeni]|jgi:NAD(P)-dependent dehydrogenase (short-subunit alcohol dehydrogenase family)|uniref:SDR family oxidoreductase n=2 Tax=Nocardioidaceae TaxID=85015 RepID=A0A7J5DZ05_NOCSI|nr:MULTISPECIES: SDR family oxidoreductase [Nocardioidaceae]KAB2811138.1 SDR family oxidoreductase [Pimelobacter simplex]THV13386.1 SDR family oxidoreductase [Nocardioides caeni]UUW88495.1 SDR family oxidoreductase [Pimelobacter simplex]UUW98000.1 SDR family oxidoreductase [Pimelobacter simplex]